MWISTSLRSRHVHETLALAEPGAVRGNSPPSPPFDDHFLLAVVMPGKLGVLLHKWLELIRFQQPVELLVGACAFSSTAHFL